jgi:hypothetical protein
VFYAQGGAVLKGPIVLFSGPWSESKGNWAGQVQAAPMFWSLGASFDSEEGPGPRWARLGTAGRAGTNRNAAWPGKAGGALVAG